MLSRFSSQISKVDMVQPIRTCKRREPTSRKKIFCLLCDKCVIVEDFRIHTLPICKKIFFQSQKIFLSFCLNFTMNILKATNKIEKNLLKTLSVTILPLLNHWKGKKTSFYFLKILVDDALGIVRHTNKLLRFTFMIRSTVHILP